MPPSRRTVLAAAGAGLALSQIPVAASAGAVAAELFTLVRAASRKWRRLNGTNQLPRVSEGVTFTDGVAQADAIRNRVA